MQAALALSGRLPRRRRFGRPRILVVGCGDIGLRCAALLRERFRLFALTSQPTRRVSLRAAGLVPLIGNLDDRRSLARVARVARDVLHLAPPQPAGIEDRRTRALLAALGSWGGVRSASCVPRIGARGNGAMLARRHNMDSFARAMAASVIVPERHSRFAMPGRPRRPRCVRIVYMSTTGVYGDCGGALIDETRSVRPVNARAARRVSAERQLRHAGSQGAVRVTILRAPGIYAADRLPLARLRSRTPALCDADDVYTGHIHANDLAAVVVRALTRGRSQRVVHAADDTQWKMGEYFDRVAQACGLPPVPRIARAKADATLEATLLSFMRESRRLANRRLRDELGVRLRYPSVEHFLREHTRMLRQRGS